MSGGEPKKDGMASKVFRAVGQAAGKLLTTATHTAATTGQRAALKFVSRVGDREIPKRTTAQLAISFLNWLHRRSKGQAERKGTTVELVDGQDGRQEVVLQEPGILGQTYPFVFLAQADGQFLRGVVYMVLEWPPGRSELAEDVTLFVWNDGVRLGPGGAAADYISLWLVDELGFRFESLELCESGKGKSTLSNRLYVGREDELSHLVELASRPNPAPTDPWIVSLTGLGGNGKSYFLRQFQQRLSKRVLFALVDHQNCEGCEQSLEQGLISLLQSLALGFTSDGCPTPNFDRLYTRKMRIPPESNLKGYVRKAVDFGAGKNPLMSLASTGWQAVDTVSEEIQAEADALASNSWVRRLTAALVSDLQHWTTQQRKHYYLWRRPVIVLDTYELLAVLADNWLRVVLLGSPEFIALRPLVILASRHDLLRVNSRWSEFQGSLDTVVLRPFNLDETRRFLELNRGEVEQAQELLELTGGHPLFLSLVASSKSREMAIRTLVERLLEEVEASSRDLVLDMAVPEEFNLDLVGRLHPDLAEPRRAFERLLRLTFAEAHGGKWRYAPSIRQVFLTYLRLESPERLQRLQERVS